jgi:hypothetical protein
MKALIITRDLLPALLTLDNETLGRLQRSAICLVCQDRDEAPEGADTIPALMFAWTLLRERILLHGQKYDDECERRRDRARIASAASHANIPGSTQQHTVSHKPAQASRSQPKPAGASH